MPIQNDNPELFTTNEDETNIDLEIEKAKANGLSLAERITNIIIWGNPRGIMNN